MIKRAVVTILLIFMFLYFHKNTVLFIIHGSAQKKRGKIDAVTQSNISIGYIIQSKKWTTYPLAGLRSNIRVLTNANLHKKVPRDDELKFWYAIQFKVLDRQQAVLIDRTYHFHSKISTFLDEKTNQEIIPKFYLSQPLIPADLKVMVVNLTDHEKAATIKFRLHSKDEIVNDVMIRVYAKKKISKVKAAATWHRLNTHKKKTIVRGSVYPHEFISEKEKVNLLSNIWEPMGPLGVKDEDYITRRLYVLKDTEGYFVYDPVFPKGLWMDEYHYVTIPVPEKNKPILLEIEPVEKAEHILKKSMTLQWFGEKSHERITRTQPLTLPVTRITDTFGPGLIQLISQRKAVVRVFLKDDIPEEITPELKYIRVFTLSRTAPITYDIRHDRKGPTPFRVDFRYDAFPDIDYPSQKMVWYDLLDENEKHLASGAIDCKSPPSFYERLPSDFSQNRITEKVSKYFLLPKNVQQIRFMADPDIWITAYNRPYDLAKQTNVPDDYKKFRLKDQFRQPTWFSLYPRDYKKHIQTGRTISIHSQLRPPDTPPLDQSAYEWELYLPNEPWQGRYLLTHHENSTPFRKEQLPSLFQKVALNQSIPLTFMSPFKARKTVTPQLIFTKSDKKVRKITMTLNNRPYISDRIIGLRGEITLPEIATGSYQLKIKTKAKGEFFINYAGKGSINRLKRLAFRIKTKDPDGLLFSYERRSDEPEVLLLRYYTAHSKKRISRLSARINTRKDSDLKPKSAFTTLHRAYHLTANQEDPLSIVLHHPKKFLDGGQLMFLPLDSDLGKGTYTISLSLDGSDNGYVILSKITMGTYEKRYFFKERGFLTP